MSKIDEKTALLDEEKYMNFGIIIVTYNRYNLIKECIECVKKQVLKPTSVIIIDNNSTDGTADLLNSINDNNFHIIRTKENIGASGGFSLGISYFMKFNVDYILFIDDDAHIDTMYLELLKQCIEKHENIGAVSGTVIENEKIACIHRRRLKNSLTLANSNVDINEYDKDYFEYDLFSFCGIAIKRDILKKVGLPREDYFTQFTDTEYSLRIRKNTKIINVNKAVLYHKIKINKEKCEISYKMYYQVRNRIVTILTHSHYLIKPIMKIALIFTYKIRIAIRIMKIKFACKKAELYSKQIKIFNDALRDAITNRMGINKKYLP